MHRSMPPPYSLFVHQSLCSSVSGLRAAGPGRALLWTSLPGWAFGSGLPPPDPPSQLDIPVPLYQRQFPPAKKGSRVGETSPRDPADSHVREGETEEHQGKERSHPGHTTKGAADQGDPRLSRPVSGSHREGSGLLSQRPGLYSSLFPDLPAFSPACLHGAETPESPGRHDLAAVLTDPDSTRGSLPYPGPTTPSLGRPSPSHGRFRSHCGPPTQGTAPGARGPEPAYPRFPR